MAACTFYDHKDDPFFLTKCETCPTLKILTYPHCLSWIKGPVAPLGIIFTTALSPLIYFSSVIDNPDIVIIEVDIITDFLSKKEIHKIAKNVIQNYRRWWP